LIQKAPPPLHGPDGRPVLDPCRPFRHFFCVSSSSLLSFDLPFLIRRSIISPPFALIGVDLFSVSRFSFISPRRRLRLYWDGTFPGSGECLCPFEGRPPRMYPPLGRHSPSPGERKTAFVVIYRRPSLLVCLLARRSLFSSEASPGAGSLEMTSTPSL